MAPLAIILGGGVGTCSALFGWLLLGTGFWGAVQIYFAVGIPVAALMLILSLLQPEPRKSARERKHTEQPA